MDFINDINNECIIICNNENKIKLLKRNKLVNIKVMTMLEFISKYCFKYDENAVIYIMEKYNIKYEIATMYLRNIYYIEEKEYNVKKLDFLVSLKKELDNLGLLKYNTLFQEYIKNILVYVYGIRLGKYEKNLLKNVDYKYISREDNRYEHEVFYFDTLELEVEYIANCICKLIFEGIDIRKIKLTNVDSSYYNTIERIFTLFGLKVNIPYSTSLLSFQVVREFVDNYRNNDLEYALSKITPNDKMYEIIIDTINKYIKYDNKDLIIYKLENTIIYSDEYDNAISIVDYLNYSFDDEEYVFMLGFNDGLVPNSYKDTDYITDNIKKYVYLDGTKEKNEYLRIDILNNIYNIKNLIITYKLRDTKKTFYPSSMCSYFNVLKGEIDISVGYSEVYNKIKLTRCIDDYIKYGYKNLDFDLLYSNYKIRYNSFNNEYTLINRVMDKLILSYSKMQIYNKCAFRYYLSDILKLDIFEENFSTVIGNMVHYTMEKCLSNNDMDCDKYVLEFLGERQFSKKEQFFLEKYKLAIHELLEQVLLEKEYGLFDNTMYEKKINIDYGDNVKFTGVIDKVLYKEINGKTYVALVDYKTGNDDISLKYLRNGLDIQLPIYLYLSNYLNLRNVLFSGFYLQKFNIVDKDYRLVGYSNSDRDILSIIDNGYDNSKIIKGMKTNKDGSFSRYAKVLSNDEISEIIEITKEKIDEVIFNIKNNKFEINPKVIEDKNVGCNFCKFKDICFVKKKNFVEITEDKSDGDE